MKKGFTLIELLAVISILAIISLIATPIVLDIIKDTKESTILTNAELYLKGVKQSVLLARLDNNRVKDGIYSLTEDGNICVGKFTGNICNGDILKVEAKGNLPTKGSISITDGKIDNIILAFNNKIISTNEKGKLIFGIPISDYIKKIYRETKTTIVNSIEYSMDETNSLINDRLGSSSVNKADGNIRYYGANPNNYIDIGDRDSEGNIIFWRIIGLFKDIEVTDEEGKVIKTEDLVKIIRVDFLTSEDVEGFSWDYTSTGAYDNNWNDSTLQVMLNDEIKGYYASGTTSYYNNNTTPITLSFSSTGLSSETHDKIERVKWSLGGHNSNSVYTDAMYGYERAGTNTWSGKIALMYPSDYGYSADLSSCQGTLYNYENSTCTATNWMYNSTKYQTTLIPNSSAPYAVFYVYLAGGVSNRRNVGYADGVRPVLYLKSDVGIVAEKETSDGLKYFVVE